MLNTTDKLSRSKHRLLGVLFNNGKKVDKNGRVFYDFLSDKQILELADNKLSLEEIDSVTTLLKTSKDIGVNINKINITNIGVASFIHKSYLKLYRKSVYENVIKILQVIILFATIYFLISDRLSYNIKVDKLVEESEKINNHIIKQDSDKSKHEQMNSEESGMTK